MEDTETPKIASTSEDPDAQPFHSDPPPPTPINVGNTPPPVMPVAEPVEQADDDYEEDQPQRVAHYLENLIEETNHELDRIHKAVSVIQIMLGVVTVAAVMYVAVQVRKRA